MTCPTCGNDITKREAAVILEALVMAAPRLTGDHARTAALLVKRIENHLKHDTMYFKPDV